MNCRENRRTEDEAKSLKQWQNNRAILIWKSKRAENGSIYDSIIHMNSHIRATYNCSTSTLQLAKVNNP